MLDPINDQIYTQRKMAIVIAVLLLLIASNQFFKTKRESNSRSASLYETGVFIHCKRNCDTRIPFWERNCAIQREPQKCLYFSIQNSHFWKYFLTEKNYAQRCSFQSSLSQLKKKKIDKTMKKNMRHSYNRIKTGFQIQYL